MAQKTTDLLKFPTRSASVAPASPANTGIKPGISVAPKSESEFNSFRALIDDWLSYCCTYLSPETIEDYQNKTFKFWWWWDKFHAGALGVHPVNVTSKHAQAFVVYLKAPAEWRWGEKVKPGRETLSQASVASYVKTVKVFFSWLEQEGHIPQTPFNKSVKISSKQKQSGKIIKRVEQDELTRIFQALTQPDYQERYTGCRNLAMISLLLDSGMRKGELLALRLCDVSLEKNRAQIAGKTGERWAFFSDVCQQALGRYLNEFRFNQEKEKTLIPAQNSTSPLWLTEDGAPLSYDGFSSVVRQIKQVSGVNFSAHKFRHTFATWMVRKADLYSVQRMLGHASIKTTEIYLHSNPDEIEASYRPNSPLDNLAGHDPAAKRRRGRPRKK